MKQYGPRDWAAGAVVGIAILALAIWIKSSPGTGDKMCADKGYAWVMAGKFVKQRLKSPDTANFPHQPDSYSYSGECRHSIVGTVDSQNGFGAMIRSTFSVTMIYRQKEDKWKAENLQIH